MEKIYKIKFSSENNKEMFTHSPDRKWHILDEGKHFVTVKAKSKTDLRNQKKSLMLTAYIISTVLMALKVQTVPLK